MKGENMSNKIIAIDPGNEYSGFVVVEHDKYSIKKVLEKGKVENERVFEVLDKYEPESAKVAIEMIASYGMAVGATVFDTCVWIGRYTEYAKRKRYSVKSIYRKDEKMTICGDVKANDSNIRVALIDEYARNTPNGGKGRKDSPGFFYGFKADIWAAFAVAHTYFEIYLKEFKRV